LADPGVMGSTTRELAPMPDNRKHLLYLLSYAGATKQLAGPPTLQSATSAALWPALADAYRLEDSTSFAFRYLRNKEDAEEITQDVPCSRSTQKSTRFRASAAVVPGIYRITFFHAAMSRAAPPTARLSSGACRRPPRCRRRWTRRARARPSPHAGRRRLERHGRRARACARQASVSRPVFPAILPLPRNSPAPRVMLRGHPWDVERRKRARC